FRVKIGPPVPALRGDFRNTIAACFEVVPKLGQVFRTRVTPRQTDNRHIADLRLAPGGPCRGSETLALATLGGGWRALMLAQLGCRSRCGLGARGCDRSCFNVEELLEPVPVAFQEICG